jgi:hypothetical protein
MKLTGRARAVWLAVVWGLLTAGAASAQVPAGTLRVGDRVRLTISGSPITGRIVSGDDSQVTILASLGGTAARERTIDWDKITRIERSDGSQSNTFSYALGGMGLGVLVGIGSWYIPATYGYQLGYSTPCATGILGMLIGAAIGSSHPYECWHTLSSDGRVGLLIGSPSAPMAVGIRVSF